MPQEGQMRTVTTKWIIDASGKAAVLAKKLGMQHSIGDEHPTSSDLVPLPQRQRPRQLQEPQDVPETHGTGQMHPHDGHESPHGPRLVVLDHSTLRRQLQRRRHLGPPFVHAAGRAFAPVPGFRRIS
jgi:hypothetical protein